jgi:hypothetical protein
VLEAQEVLARALSPEELARLTREVQNFAFDAALAQLRAIAARLRTATAGGDGAALGAALSRLETMLADGNGEALDCALAAQELLERGLGEEEAGALLREVGDFDFDAALVRVRNIAARLAPPLGESVSDQNAVVSAQAAVRKSRGQTNSSSPRKRGPRPAPGKEQGGGR